MKTRTFVALAALVALTVSLVKGEELFDLVVRVVGSTSMTVLLESITGRYFPNWKVIKD